MYIVKHKEVLNFYLVEDVYHLPFEDKKINCVLSSYTIEHLDNPRVFLWELERVGSITVWYLVATFNVLESK